MTAEEVTAAREVVEAAGLLRESTKFVYVGLEEPHKRDVLAWTPGSPVERRLRVLLLDRATGAGRDLTVSVTGRSVVRDDDIAAVAGGRAPTLAAKFEPFEPILAAHERWVSAMAKRGLDVAEVRAVPLS